MKLTPDVIHYLEHTYSYFYEAGVSEPLDIDLIQPGAREKILCVDINDEYKQYHDRNSQTK